MQAHMYSQVALVSNGYVVADNGVLGKAVILFELIKRGVISNSSVHEPSVAFRCADFNRFCEHCVVYGFI